MEVVKLTESELKRAIKQKTYIVVDCYAKWCGPCKMQSQVMKRAAEDIEGCLFYKVDIDESDEVVIEYQITSVPTLLFFKDGKLFKKHVGMATEEEILKILTTPIKRN